MCELTRYTTEGTRELIHMELSGGRRRNNNSVTCLADGQAGRTTPFVVRGFSAF